MSIRERNATTTSKVLKSFLDYFIQPSSQSILPFIPRSVRYILFLILLVNIRSWPIVWHVRVFLPLLRIRLTQFLHVITFKSKADSTAYFRKLLFPIGKNPIESRTIWKSWASPDDCDYNFHLSNSSYPARLDSARFKAALEYYTGFVRAGGNLFLGGTHFSFIREIPINSAYEIRMSIPCWDQKWMYIVAQYVIPPTPSNKKRLKITGNTPTITTPQSQPKEFAESLTEALSSKTPSSLTVPPLPVTPSTPGNPNARQVTYTEDGWIVACTAISLVCCKYGRSTVPVPLALAMSGWLMTPEEFKTLSEMHKPIDNTEEGKGKQKMTTEAKELLKGGWRAVVAKQEASGYKISDEEEELKIGEGIWWEKLMRRQGVQAKVDENLKKLGRVREGMELAKEII